ncbi:MAG: hypothetical protein JWN52_5625 [Actinomycetia bacterium]|jgi:hypothetical protein|nr:hypothetical protein [Actinomycetes bacterium]
MSAYTLGLIGAFATLAAIFEMLRRRRLREKYAVFWVLLALVIVVIAVFPGVLVWAAHVTGVVVPANLLFFVASLVLISVNVQLSSEITRLEDKSRTLAEDLALQRLQLEDLAARYAGEDQ